MLEASAPPSSSPRETPGPTGEEPHRRKRRRKKPRRDGDPGPGPLLNSPQVTLAIYIAMAHGGLALSLALLYGLGRLLEQYWRPIQWAVLCSMPLRKLHAALVGFWSLPLCLGLPETLLAVPLALLRAAIGSLIDSQTGLLRLLRRRGRSGPTTPRRVGFSKLMQWLASFGLFVLAFERAGPAAIPFFVVPGLLAYRIGFGAPGVARTLSAISSARHPRGPPANPSLLSRLSRYLTSGLHSRLNTLVSIGLIASMIVGTAFGLGVFSYKIGVESKGAVLSLKTHFQKNNYAERMGIIRWLDENQIQQLVDSYTETFYQTLSQQVDSLASHYNVTEFVDIARRYFNSSTSSATAFQEQAWHEPFFSRTRQLLSRIRHGEMGSVLREFQSSFAKEDLVGEMKEFLLQSVDVSKRVLASITVVLAGSAKIVFKIIVSIVSGAAGLLNFVSQVMVFFWVLYYLINSDSGGVMDQVLEMVPVSEETRACCAEVLGRAISSVLLATAKVTIFQGCLTYLLFRFYRIHFLYMSTFLALMSALLPITPTWLSTIPAAAQLAMEGRYIEAFGLGAVHLLLMDYGASLIQDDVSGRNAYLTGLSILGGMALFPSALEGAIMGPLLMTVVIALKNLYVEFVLASAKEICR